MLRGAQTAGPGDRIGKAGVVGLETSRVELSRVGFLLHMCFYPHIGLSLMIMSLIDLGTCKEK
ncbi:hypothetical protein M433DRAFT_148502 [Acidomyces richmondensis BFW]|nr:MAG: hypothetical protein FE78DRAFT_81494 [Acidomyces sp. 'richmondensis']KYG40167.1 hypothetical protein M433DRAFT_148502 [Acidomyces richmondensis BFW]